MERNVRIIELNTADDYNFTVNGATRVAISMGDGTISVYVRDHKHDPHTVTVNNSSPYGPLLTMKV